MKASKRQNIINEALWTEMMSHGNFSGEVKFNEPMKDHTSLKIGGPADVLVFPNDTISLENMLAALDENRIPFMPIGGGTNLLVRDGGINGVVVSVRNFKRVEILKEERDLIMLFVESGVPLSRLVTLSRENGYTGMEEFVGIPGLVGGAIAGNSGAFGRSMKNVLVSARVLDADKGVHEIVADEFGLEYRESKMPAGSIILSSNIKMRKDIIKEDVIKRIEGFIRKKRERQPISEVSAGCVFKNPEGASAGKLIDETGCKGMRIGDVEVSAVHANFFINKGNASAADFIKLMDEVKAKVVAVFGVELEPEIRIVGQE